MQALDIWPIFGPKKHHVDVDGVRIALSTVLSIILRFISELHEDNIGPSGTLDSSRKRYEQVERVYKKNIVAR